MIFKKMLTLFLNFQSVFFRRRLISVFVDLNMFTMISIDPYHDGFLERYNGIYILTPIKAKLYLIGVNLYTIY